jgi:hypothetical protein
MSTFLLSDIDLPGRFVSGESADSGLCGPLCGLHHARRRRLAKSLRRDAVVRKPRDLPETKDSKMSRPPRSKRVAALLDSLQNIHANAELPATERLAAAQLAAQLLGGAKKKPAKRNAKASNVTSALAQIRKMQEEAK